MSLRMGVQLQGMVRKTRCNQEWGTCNGKDKLDRLKQSITTLAKVNKTRSSLPWVSLCPHCPARAAMCFRAHWHAASMGRLESARPLQGDVGLRTGHGQGTTGPGSSPAPTTSLRSAEDDKQGFIIFCPPAQCWSYSADSPTMMIQTRPLLSCLSRFFPAWALFCTGDGQSLPSLRTDSNVQPAPSVPYDTASQSQSTNAA